MVIWIVFQTGATLRRYIVGSIIEEDGSPALKDVDRLKQLEEALRNAGFKDSEFPGVQNAAFVEFPWRTSFSVWIAVNRVYGALHNFLKVRDDSSLNKLCWLQIPALA